MLGIVFVFLVAYWIFAISSTTVRHDADTEYCFISFSVEILLSPYFHFFDTFPSLSINTHSLSGAPQLVLPTPMVIDSSSKSIVRLV